MISLLTLRVAQIDTEVTRFVMIERLPAGCGRILQGEEEVLRVLGSRKKWIAATVGVAVIGTFVTVALASHTPFNFTQEVKSRRPWPKRSS